jgi:hypothetical protein
LCRKESFRSPGGLYTTSVLDIPETGLWQLCRKNLSLSSTLKTITLTSLYGRRTGPANGLSLALFTH